MKGILVTGAYGQIGTELARELSRRHGAGSVIASSRRPEPPPGHAGPSVQLDVTDRAALERVLLGHEIDTIFHLAAVLSAAGERDPQAAWRTNTRGLLNVLEAARSCGVRQVFWPSSIAAFGPETPREATPQETVTRPTTIYGISKVTGELLCDYYAGRYGLDVRGVRYPGVISSEALPGGGTTDYAVEMFYAALRRGHYRCFVREDTVLPMIYMHDCIKAALDLMDADGASLIHRNGCNVAAMSFSAGELAAAVAEHVAGFTCEYAPDERQAIADSWPRSIDDSAARAEWGWSPEFDLERTAADMIRRLRARGVGQGA